MAAGNGAAIRVAPLAFALDLSTRHGRQMLRDVSRITHHSDEAYVGALAIALTIQDAVTGEWRGRGALFEMLLDQLPDTRVSDRLLEVRDGPASIVEAGTAFGTSGYVVDAVPLAVHAHCWAAEADDFVSMVAQLVEAGGDCDSIGSMADQCLGALRGEGPLPPRLVGQLGPSIADTANRLARTL